jgi:hypothetical protein
MLLVSFRSAIIKGRCEKGHGVVAVALIFDPHLGKLRG